MVQDETRRHDECHEIANTCLTHLRAEEAILEQLATIVGCSHQALVDRNVHALIETGEQLQAQHAAALEIGERRRNLQRALGVWLGVPPEHVTMSRVVEQLDDDLRPQCAAIQRRLQDRVLRLSHTLHDNAMIAAQQNLVIDQTLAALTGQIDQRRYGASGQLQPGQGSSIFEAEL